MRDKTLGRWILRLVVTIGAGSAAVGLSAAAAQAAMAPSSYIASVTSAVSVGVGQLTAPPPYVPITEDFGWS